MKRARRPATLKVGITQDEWDRCWLALYDLVGVTREEAIADRWFLLPYFFHQVVKARGHWYFIVRRGEEAQGLTVGGLERQFIAIPCAVTVARSGTKLAKSLFGAYRQRGYATEAACPHCGCDVTTGHHDRAKYHPKHSWRRRRVLPRSYRTLAWRQRLEAQTHAA